MARSLLRLIVAVLSVTVAADARGQLGYWPLDGDLTDAEGAHDGVYSGGPAPVFVRGYDGTENGAIFLDGVNDFVRIPDEFSDLAISSEFTLALWFRASSTGQSQKYLLSRNAPGAQYAIIYEYTDDHVDFFAPSRLFGDDPRAGGMSEMPLADTEWHHIAYTYDGVVWSGYIDGVEIFSNEISFALDNIFISDWYIGAANPGAAFVGGAIDDVRIYEFALDPEDIEDLASGKVADECPAEGDSHCSGLTFAGPEDGGPGIWTATASGVDDSGDALLYTFTAESEDGATRTAGPQSSNEAELNLDAGTWTVTVFVDDDPFCGDMTDDPSCSEVIEVNEAAPKLVAHWTFDATLEDSADSHDGVFFGDVEPFYGEGHDGTEDGAILLDGLDDYVEVQEAPDLKLTDRFTLALWFKSASTEQSQKYLLSKNGGGGQYAIIFEYTNDRVDFFAPTRLFGDDPRAGGLSEMPLEDTDWHHIAYTYDGSTWSGYIDGIQVFSRTISFALSDEFTSNWYIGAANPTVNYVEGAIDDVRIYNYALTAEEVQELSGFENPCPVEGDTRVTSFEVEPDGGEPGLYEAIAEATDDSGDEILYTFTASRGGTPVTVIGPQPESNAIFDLGTGEWEISVKVDDDPLCPDVLPEAVSTLPVSIGFEPQLVAHLELDGDLIDSANANDGVFFGDAFPFFVEGHDGTEEGAISLDGVDDYVEIFETPALKLTDHFTLALWFKSARTDQSQKYLLSKNGGGGQYAIIYEYTDDRVDFYAPNRLFGDDPRAGGLSEMPLGDTNWHHIAYTYDGMTFSGYIDGEQIFSREISFALSDQFSSSWFIGAANPTVAYVEGAIDDVRIYNYGLTAEEIAELAGAVVEEPLFIRGDADASGSINITDGVFILNFLFQGGGDPPCKDAADADNMGGINITDGIYVLNFLFLGGGDPAAPYPGCGADPDGDADGIDCATTQASCL